MTSIFDVAKFILDEEKEVTAFKLQKLCYYAQAWSLAIDDKPIFADKFEAWVHGPVCRLLFNSHKGGYTVSEDVLNKGDKDNISPNNKDIIDAVLLFYRNYNGNELEELTHSEFPWKYARKGYLFAERYTVELDESIMRDYYRTKKEDYSIIDDMVLTFRANRRCENTDKIVSFKEMMESLDISAGDIEEAEDLEFEIE